MTLAIETYELKKTYGGRVPALDGLTFDVVEGQVFGLLGPNGAGKSTAMRILVTLTRPDGGSARVAGFDVARDPQAVRRMIGYVPQGSNADSEATARENLRLRGRIQRMPKRMLDDRIDELLHLFDLSFAADRLVGGYSGGMRRRLDVALGLIHRPRILFLDEPTTGLDPEARTAMWQELDRLTRQEELTILLTTHYLDEVDRLAQRVAIVGRGRVVAEGSPDELKRRLAAEQIEVELTQAADPHLGLVGQLDLVRDVHSCGNVMHAQVETGHSAVPEIVGALLSSGVGVASVRVRRPTMDDVYLHFAHADRPS